MFQFAVVNVRLAPPLTDRSVSPEARATLTVTSAAGWNASFTVKVLVRPSVTDTAVDDTTSDCVSLSASVPVTLTVVSPLDVTSNTADPFVRSTSSAAASVTVCAVFQFAVVNVSELPPLTDRSVSPEARATLTVTLAAGWNASFTVKVFVRPSVTDTAVDDTTSDCASLSASVPVTLTVAKPVDVTSNMAEPFARSTSSAAARVTV